MKNKAWFYVAIGCIMTSIISMFASVIVYINQVGNSSSYNIISLLEGDDFSNYVLTKYTGPVLLRMPGYIVTLFAVIGIISIICAIVGLFTLRVQYPNTWQFVLTIVGLVGTLIPSGLIIFGVMASGQYFVGELRCGLYPIITPIAMAISVAAVLRRRDKVKQMNLERLASQGMIRKAGDLDIQGKLLQYKRKDEL